MTLQEVLADYDRITIRTDRGSGEIYIGRAADVDYGQINAFCLSRLNSAFIAAQNGVIYAARSLRQCTKAEKEAAERQLKIKEAARENALQRLKDFIPVEVREVVDIYNSALDSRYYFITITGTEGGLEYNPVMTPLNMTIDGAVNLTAGIYTNAATELLSYIRKPPAADWKKKEIEEWVLLNPLQSTVDGNAFLREVYMKAAYEKLCRHLVTGTPVPKKWRKNRRMNQVVLMGRTTADIELKEYGNEGGVRATFTLAVNRRNRNDGADFIYCVIFGKRAEALAKYVQKGTQILINGRLNSRTYETEEGRKQNTISVIVEDWEFCESKSAAQARQGAGSEPPRREQSTRREQDRQPARREQDRRRRDYEDDYYREPDFR